MELQESWNSLLNETRTFKPSSEISQRSHIKSFDEYEAMYRRSIEDSDSFWLEQTATLDWVKFPTAACKYVWNTKARDIRHTWFEDGELNCCFNCLDRHLARGKGGKTAILWQGDQKEDTRNITFQQLHALTCQFANVLKSKGIQEGDRVCIYMPMIPEAVVAMLACARIGAIHSVVFGGFSAEALAYRIQDSTSKMLITANVGLRGGKKIPLKEIADTALQRTPSIESVIVVQRTGDPCSMGDKDFWYHNEMALQPEECPPAAMQAEDPLCILYTSGSTGKPKGVVHTQAGYLLHVSLSHKYIFDIHEDDIYWCTADIGWVTGHSYLVYGPLANGCTTLLFEGIPTHPHSGRCWEIIDQHNVTVFYTAPTLIRSLIAQGGSAPQEYDLSSLRILGSVGEPINPEVWLWYYQAVGKGRCPIVDTWWQTETGGVLISALPGSHTLKPGSASRPFFGVEPIVVREDGTRCDPLEGGALCIRKPWPGMIRTIWGDQERLINTYFSTQENLYFTGDGCHVDEEGDFWLLGRMDDVVNVSGHRIGTAEVESALVSHKAIAEAAVVPIKHPIKGQGLYAFVIPVDGTEITQEFRTELLQHVRKEIGAIAVPEEIQFAEALPKTRSGKIMRRILRKIADNELDDFGDISTLTDPAILEKLLGNQPRFPAR